jgi:peroxiredoxin Q/BCP
MALKVNIKAPDFSLPDSEGKIFNLKSTLEEKEVVIFFYPKAFTAGCTAEACSFRDDYSFFRERNIAVIGISHDSEETQSRFLAKYRLPYLLLSDHNRKVCRLYDAVFPFGLLTKRVSYYINREGKILSVVDNLFNAGNHLETIRKKILSMEVNSAESKV